jgi:hypothetical protein
MAGPHFPSLYQINTRVWLTQLSQQLGRLAPLDDIDDEELDQLIERRVRLRLVPERQADWRGRTALATQQSRVAKTVSSDIGRPSRG